MYLDTSDPARALAKIWMIISDLHKCARGRGLRGGGGGPSLKTADDRRD